MADRSVKPRKAPRQARATETVRIILEAAARLLETKGYDGYTTNRVAELAGVSIGSLYQYFPGKDALTAALILREKTCLLEEVAAINALDPDLALRQVIAACAAHQMRRPALARLLDMEEMRLSLPEQQADATDRLLAILRAILIRFPSPPADGIDSMAADCLAIIKGISDFAGERGETDMASLRTRIDRAVFGYLGRTLPE